MKHRIYCEVCQVSFIHKGDLQAGSAVVCTVCGAKLKVSRVEPEVKACRYQEPEAEIRERVETFTRLRGYVFNEEKESIIDGLIEKHRLFGDFYCPCRFEHDQDNVCPCLETRMNRVRKNGSCY